MQRLCCAPRRRTKYNDCIAAAAAGRGGYRAPAGQLVAVVTFPGIDAYGMPGVGERVDGSIGFLEHN